MSKARKNKSGGANRQSLRPSVAAAAAAPGAVSSAPKGAMPSAGGQPLAHIKAMPKYAALMEGVKEKITAIDAVLPQLVVNGVGDLAKLQMVALLFRQMLETVAFASLVINKVIYDQVHQDAARQWSAKKLLDKIEKLNPQFYPTPIVDLPSGDRQRKIVSKVSGFLTRQEFVALYDACSGIIHQKNPFDQTYGYTEFAQAAPEWRTKLIELLNAHQLHLPGDSGFYVVHMQEAGDERVHWYRFELVNRAT